MSHLDLIPLPARVLDVEGVPYDLTTDSILGTPGGFGAVFTVGSFAVKIFKRGCGESPETLSRLGQLPIQDLRIARFVRPISGTWSGYVMELVPSMSPWRALVTPPTDFAGWWDRFGGYKRRLALSADIAGTMSALAQRGLVFADLNYNNVLFDHSATNSHETWLIDIDNLRFGASDALAFPGYGAPELWAGRVRSTTLATDAWSLAVLVFTTLTAAHPFESGTYVNEGSPDIEPLEAWRGEVPWIDDPVETWNRTQAGLDRRLILTRGLQGYFGQMFGPGRSEPEARPSVGELHRLLELAALLVVTCPGCSQSTLARRTCPFCHTPIDARLIAVQRQPLTRSQWSEWAEDSEAHGPDDIVPLVRPEYIALTDGDVKIPPAWTISYQQDGPPVVELRRSGDRIRARALRDDVPVWYRKANSSWKPLRGDTAVGTSGDWMLRIGPESGPYTLLRPPQGTAR